MTNGWNELELSVREMMARDPQRIYANAAMAFIAALYGMSFDELNAIHKHGWRADLRIINLAANLFLLAEEPALGGLLRRLENENARDRSRSAHMEIETAATLASLGYRITGAVEHGKRGLDFDFTAEDEGSKVNAEVTLLRNRDFSIRSVRNALNAKRSQLPSDAPAIIAIAIPGRWLSEDLSNEIDKEINRFLKGTGRVNYVLAIRHFTVPGPNTLVKSHEWVENPRARHDHSDLKRRIAEVVYPSDGKGAFHLWVDNLAAT